MVKTFSCKCGNKDPHQTVEYHGLLGYEALICKKCGRYSDYSGDHEPEKDKNSILYFENIR